MNGKVSRLLDRIAQLSPENGHVRLPLLTTEGRAWLNWCLLHLTSEEESERNLIMEQANALKSPDWKDPTFNAYWEEQMRLLHRFGELEKLGESRALLEPADAWPRYLAHARVELAQLEKVMSN